MSTIDNRYDKNFIYAKVSAKRSGTLEYRHDSEGVKGIQLSGTSYGKDSHTLMQRFRDSSAASLTSLSASLSPRIRPEIATARYFGKSAAELGVGAMRTFRGGRRDY